MGRIVGIDYGMKRVGIATTDPLQIIVNALTTVDTDQFLHFIDQYIVKENVEKIVFGSPTHKDGNDTYLKPHIDACLAKIKEKHPHLAFDFQDESMTSVEAKQAIMMMGTKKSKRTDKAFVDRVSATIILQKYLKHS